VHQDSAGKQETYLDYDANAVTYLLVNAVKEQQGQFEALKAENESLKQELAQIKQALNRLSPEGNTSVARLDQNRPNPFTQTTAIGYFIPDNTTSAQLKIFSVKGQEIYSQELLQKGEGQVVLSTEILKAGTYIYQLVVDGKRVGNKKLVLTR
jgi:cell division protein FtsB